MAWELLGFEQCVPLAFRLPETTPEAWATVQPSKQRGPVEAGPSPHLGALQPPTQAPWQRGWPSQPSEPTPPRSQGGALRPGRPSTWVQCVLAQSLGQVGGLVGVVSGGSTCPLESLAFLLFPSSHSGFVSVEQSRAEPSRAAPQTPLLGIAGGPGTWAGGRCCTEWRSLPLRGRIGWGLKLIRLCSREGGRLGMAFACPSVLHWWVPVERAWGTAGHLQELLMTETVFWDFAEKVGLNSGSGNRHSEAFGALTRTEASAETRGMCRAPPSRPRPFPRAPALAGRRACPEAATVHAVSGGRTPCPVAYGHSHIWLPVPMAPGLSAQPVSRATGVQGHCSGHGLTTGSSAPCRPAAVASAASDRVRAGRGRHRDCCSGQSWPGLGYILLPAPPGGPGGIASVPVVPRV